MNHIKSVARSTRKFVADHKVGLAVVVTTFVCVAINREAIREHNDFLKEHNLYEKFYTPQ